MRLNAQRVVADRKWSDEYELRVEAENKSASVLETCRARVDRYRAALTAAIVYGILVTVCAGICTAEFQAACMQFGQLLLSTGPAWQAVFGFPAWCADGAAAGIGSEAWAGVMYWIAMIGTWGLIGFGLLKGTAAAGRFFIYCWDHLRDWQSLAVSLITVAVGVFFAGPLQQMGINAVFLMLLVIIGYLAVRGIRVYRKSR